VRGPNQPLLATGGRHVEPTLTRRPVAVVVDAAMRADGRSTTAAGSRLTRQFGLLSLAVITGITLTLAVVLSFYLRRDLLEHEWGVTADFVRTEAAHHLTPADFMEPGTPLAQAHLRDFYAQTVLLPEIVRVKIYDANMTVIWSDEPRLMGQRFPDNPQLRGALAGRTTVDLPASTAKDEHQYERGLSSELVELYVPITFPGTARAVGVVETYKAPTRVFAGIRQAWMTVFGTALAGGVVLYGSLFWIVRRAARRIDDQQVRLIAASEQLRSMQAQLVEAERMAAIGEVVAAVAHGIRNPLANIRVTAEMATIRCATCEFAPKNTRLIIGEVDRMDARLRELLRFVRPGERPRRAVDLNVVVRETVQGLGGRLRQTAVTLTAHLAPELPPISGDPVLLEQVFVGLIGNAIEASSGQDDTITITTGTERSPRGVPSVFAEVADTGVGISPESLASIFEPFYTTKAQGTGLGLAVAKKFTEAYGGTITVASRPREGATFRVTFPGAAPVSGGA